MLVKTYASAVHGVDAKTITVEVNAGGPYSGQGPLYFMVGLPDSVVREGFPRIEAALKNSRLEIHMVNWSYMPSYHGAHWNDKPNILYFHWRCSELNSPIPKTRLRLSGVL